MKISNTNRKPILLDQVRHKIRIKHDSIRTEEAYLGWIKRFILFHNKKHPESMGATEIEAFLTHRSVVGNVSARTIFQTPIIINFPQQFPRHPLL